MTLDNRLVVAPIGTNFGEQNGEMSFLHMNADNYIPRLYKLCETIHQYGTKIAIQLNHAGASAMESLIGIQPVSASATPNKAGGAIPHALTVEEIYSIADDYATAAKRHKPLVLMQ